MSREDQGHVPEHMLEFFFRGQLSRQESRKLVRHLLTRCSDCLEMALLVGRRSGWISSRPSEETTQPSVEEILGILRGAEAETLRLAQEQREGIGLLAELEKQLPGDRFAMIQGNPRFHHRGLFNQMLAQYVDWARSEPESGIQLVYLALSIVDLLPRDLYKPELLNDFRVAGLAALANAQRLAGFFEESKQAIKTAWMHLDLGTGDPLEKANLLSIEASLWRDLGHLDRSVEILDRAIQICRHVGDNNHCAHMLTKKGLADGYKEPARGIRVLQDALASLSTPREPRLELCIRHNQALFLNDAGQPQEALVLLGMTRPLYAMFGDPHTQLLLHWLEARIASSLGHFTEAEAVLHKVTDDFERQGMPYEQKLASIDLAHVYRLRRNL
jgi:tetratricopeptide (TPR) repeat protein